MGDELLKKCKLMIENKERLKGAFAWESTYVYPLCAGLFAVNHVDVEENVIKDNLELIKENTGILSSFRGGSKLAFATILTLEENTEDTLYEVLSIYEKLNRSLLGSEYLAAAACILQEITEKEKYDQAIEKTIELYEKMEKEHPHLTSSEDCALAPFFFASTLSTEQLIDEMEACYDLLKPAFLSANSVQALSQVLVLGTADYQSKCKRVLELYDLFKNLGYKYGMSFDLASLGLLSLLETDMNKLVCDIIEADDYLKENKGFGDIMFGAKQRLTHAGLLTMYDYLENCQSALRFSHENKEMPFLATSQVALCAAIDATGAAVEVTSAV